MLGDPRFFRRSGPFDLQTIAATAAAQPSVAAAASFIGVAPLQTAGASEVSFLDNRRYADALAATTAGAVIVHPDMAARVPAGSIALVTREPYLAWARVCTLFFPVPPATPGIHPTAAVDPTAQVDPSAEIGPYAVIGPDAQVGPRCRLAAHATLGEAVTLGADCRIGAHVSISHAIIGSRVVVYPGARIGQDGFGFASSAAGHVSVPQLGRVLIGDDTEIGANSCIDRGSAQDTVIGPGCRIDNLVQIGHNVRLGRACVIVAQVGISGSTILEDFVVMGGQSAVAGHVRIAAGARIGAQAGVISDIPARAEMVGSPAQPVRQFFRQVATLKRLAARPDPKPGPETEPGRTETD